MISSPSDNLSQSDTANESIIGFTSLDLISPFESKVLIWLRFIFTSVIWLKTKTNL